METEEISCIASDINSEFAILITIVSTAHAIQKKIFLYNNKLSKKYEEDSEYYPLLVKFYDQTTAIIVGKTSEQSEIVIYWFDCKKMKTTKNLQLSSTDFPRCLKISKDIGYLLSSKKKMHQINFKTKSIEAETVLSEFYTIFDVVGDYFLLVSPFKCTIAEKKKISPLDSFSFDDTMDIECISSRLLRENIILVAVVKEDGLLYLSKYSQKDGFILLYKSRFEKKTLRCDFIDDGQIRLYFLDCIKDLNFLPCSQKINVYKNIGEVTSVDVLNSSLGIVYAIEEKGTINLKKIE